ncbi:hypothetical protein [Aestuariivirga litoralis]|nr:hypothetical protein [Aestuariivirga litoralis]
MKKKSTPSQYRQIGATQGMSPEVLEELKVLKSLEARALQN